MLERIRAVPRHVFVDEALASRAYEDTALPIGHGQTISQPYIVARMTEALLEGGAPRKVLEVGTGCGYQTAVLAPLVATLYSIERIAALQLRARRAMRDLQDRERVHAPRRRIRGLAAVRAVRRNHRRGRVDGDSGRRCSTSSATAGA